MVPLLRVDTPKANEVYFVCAVSKVIINAYTRYLGTDLNQLWYGGSLVHINIFAAWVERGLIQNKHCFDVKETSFVLSWPRTFLLDTK